MVHHNIKKPWYKSVYAIVSGAGLFFAGLGAVIAFSGQACRTVNAAIDCRIMSCEFNHFDTLHKPIIDQLRQNNEMTLKTFYLVKYKMTTDDQEKAMHEMAVENGIRGKAIERKW